MNNSIFIIAEAGVNHNGDIDLAKKMIDTAADAGADAVKFQIFRTQEVMCQNSQKAEYQKTGTGDDETYYDMAKALELTENEFVILHEHCKAKNIIFLATPFDFHSIDFLVGLDVNIIKIASCEITYFPYLKKIGALKKKIVMSTGLADLNEIRSAVNVLINSGAKKEDIILLHCNVAYPTPMEDVNLRAMRTLKSVFGLEVGYSDHTIGIEASIAAVAIGARVIEKHFTMDKTLKGPDHLISLNPSELATMVQAIRNLEKCMGDGVKRVSPSEAKNKKVVRRSIVAAINIRKGDIFTEKNIAALRPGNGLNPMIWEKVIGKKAIKDFIEGSIIEL
jgi:N,N'-diacetyllegionaminate synthase